MSNAVPKARFSPRSPWKSDQWPQDAPGDRLQPRAGGAPDPGEAMGGGKKKKEALLKREEIEIYYAKGKKDFKVKRTRARQERRTVPRDIGQAPDGSGVA